MKFSNEWISDRAFRPRHAITVIVSSDEIIISAKRSERDILSLDVPCYSPVETLAANTVVLSPGDKLRAPFCCGFRRASDPSAIKRVCIYALTTFIKLRRHG